MPEEAEWLGDEVGEPLPILEPDRVAAPSRKRRPLHSVPKGNTPAGAAREARRRTLDEATGKAQPEAPDWQDELSMGNRERAASALSRRRPSSGSSFGLA